MRPFFPEINAFSRRNHLEGYKKKDSMQKSFLKTGMRNFFFLKFYSAAKHDAIGRSSLGKRGNFVGAP
jgi:hypothetical protein